jgi:GntR family transcriptional regulator
MKPAFITVDPSERRPVYQQIADGIKAMIARGELTEGMALPSVRQIAGDLGVNLNTVAVAYRELQEEQLITIKPGSGATVASRTAVRKPQELETSLRTALLNLILAGVSAGEIRNLVTSQLKELGGGVKG